MTCRTLNDHAVPCLFRHIPCRSPSTLYVPTAQKWLEVPLIFASIIIVNTIPSPTTSLFTYHLPFFSVYPTPAFKINFRHPYSRNHLHPVVDWIRYLFSFSRQHPHVHLMHHCMFICLLTVSVDHVEWGQMRFYPVIWTFWESSNLIHVLCNENPHILQE